MVCTAFSLYTACSSVTPTGTEGIKDENPMTETPPQGLTLSSGTYKSSDIKNTKQDCKANRSVAANYTLKITGETVRIDEFALEGPIRSERFTLTDRQVRDFSPQYDCALELKLRVEGKITATNQVDLVVTETLSIDGSGGTECPEAAASLGYEQFSGLQCIIEKSFRLTKE